MLSATRKFTERQLRRREDILIAAREMIADRGYDGVNMRDLAAKSGVTPKTLYHQFESKENLLKIAVEEKFRTIYESIDRAKIQKGVDRLFYVIEAVAESIQENAAYAHALAPFLGVQSSDSSFTKIRENTYQRALKQIADEGELVEWVDIQVLNNIICRQISAIFQSWRLDQIPLASWSDTVKLDVCLTLASVTTGTTHKRMTDTARNMLEKPNCQGSFSHHDLVGPCEKFGYK